MSQQPLVNLSQMTGLSPAELQRRAEQMVDVKTGTINALKALDAALVANTSTQGKASSDAFAQLAVSSANPHAIDDPAHTFVHGAPQGGYASEPPAPPSIGGPLAQLEKAAKAGQKKISGFCGGGGDGGGGGGGNVTAAATPPPAETPPPVETPPPPVVVSPEDGAATPPAGERPPTDNCPPATNVPTPPATSSAPDRAAAPTPLRARAPSQLPPALRGGAVGSPVASAPTAPVDVAPRASLPVPAQGPTSAPRPQALAGAPRNSGNSTVRGELQGAPVRGAAEEINKPGGLPNDAAVQSARAQSDVDASSRNMQFEMIKNEIQKMTELQNAVSNTLATMHEQAMTAIRNTKA